MNKDDVSGLVERLDAATKDDHERGCQGRYYACSCGYDDSNAQLLQDSKEALTTLSARVETLEAALREQTARANKHWRTVNDKQYMIEALVSMLGPAALTVWRGWLEKGIQRIHYSWGPDADNLSGEERAKIMLEWDNAPRTLVSNVDSALESQL